MSEIAIILGSARSDGNTRIIIDHLQSLIPSRVFDLNEFQIDYFDYSNSYREGDNYLELIQDLLPYETWICATPIYWYTMSAIMKTFFDRFTDTIQFHPEIGVKLKGQQIGVVSCGSSSYVQPHFAEPIAMSAKYLNMDYIGHVHTWVGRAKEVKPEVDKILSQFAQELWAKPTA